MLQGDKVKDPTWNTAVFAEMSSCHSNTKSAKARECRSFLPGHSCQKVDGERAYVRALFTGTSAQIGLPRPCWLQNWVTTWFILLVCFMLFLLYGFSTYGKHGGLHGDERLQDDDLIKVKGAWHQCLRHAGLPLNPMAYMDDFNMSSPSVNLDAGWRLNGPDVEIDVPTGMGIYLGCQCRADSIAKVSSASGCVGRSCSRGACHTTDECPHEADLWGTQE